MFCWAVVLARHCTPLACAILWTSATHPIPFFFFFLSLFKLCNKKRRKRAGRKAKTEDNYCMLGSYDGR